MLIKKRSPLCSAKYNFIYFVRLVVLYLCNPCNLVCNNLQNVFENFQSEPARIKLEKAQLKDYSRQTLLSRAFVTVFVCSIWSRAKNNVKNTLFAAVQVKIGKNNRRFVNDCFVMRRIILKILRRDCPKQNGLHMTCKHPSKLRALRHSFQ